MSPSSRKIINRACLIACAACLAVGHVMVAQWLALAVIMVCTVAWLAVMHRRLAAEWFSVILVIFIGLAVAGFVAGNPPVLMIVSAALALTSWDLALFDRTVMDLSSTPAETLALFQRSHYQSLALALGLGLLLALGGRQLRFEIPLIGMLLLVSLAFFGLHRVWRTLRH